MLGQFGIEVQTAIGWRLMRERFSSAERAHDYAMFRGIASPWRIVRIDDGDESNES